MALPADFSKIYGSTATGGLTPISDVDYAKGWEFVGSNPPTKNDFSYLQNLSDLKSQWLYSNKLQRTDPFGDIKSDGAAAISNALANLGLGEVPEALKYGAPLIGSLVMWSRSEMPQEIFLDMKMEFIPYMGQTFDGVKYPLLAALHPTLRLPADMRGEFVRGVDNTRGVDAGRALLSAQGDAIRDITGSFVNDASSYNPAGAFTLTGVSPIINAPLNTSLPKTINFSAAASGVPTAAENRPRNIAWNMIVRAK